MCVLPLSVGNSYDSTYSHIIKALWSQGDPCGEKCFCAQEEMCLMSLAAAAVVCLGWTQQEKMRHLAWATIVTTAEQSEKDKERQKTKKKHHLCSKVLSNNKPSGHVEDLDYSRCWIKLLLHYQHIGFFNLVKSRRLEEAPIITFCFCCMTTSFAI